jgi:hypothetical protein
MTIGPFEPAHTLLLLQGIVGPHANCYGIRLLLQAMSRRPYAL